jgi:hypothetical protein
LLHDQVAPIEVPEYPKEGGFKQRWTEQQREVFGVDTRVALSVHLLGVTPELVHLALHCHQRGADRLLVAERVPDLLVREQVVAAICSLGEDPAIILEDTMRLGPALVDEHDVKQASRHKSMRRRPGCHLDPGNARPTQGLQALRNVQEGIDTDDPRVEVEPSVVLHAEDEKASTGTVREGGEGLP